MVSSRLRLAPGAMRAHFRPSHSFRKSAHGSMARCFFRALIANGRSILAAQAMGADLAYMGSPFIATTEARAVDAYKQMIVDSDSSDIVYSNYFTGIAGNYLKPSIAKAGLDPDNLPQADPSKMDFEKAQQEGAKAWKDIWGCGQGIAAIKEIAPRRPHWWIVWNANIATHAQSSALALDRICVLTAHKHDLPRNRARLLPPRFLLLSFPGTRRLATSQIWTIQLAAWSRLWRLNKAFAQTCRLFDLGLAFPSFFWLSAHRSAGNGWLPPGRWNEGSGPL